MPRGQCQCGAVRYRLNPPVAYRGRCSRSKVREGPLTPLLSVPQSRFRLRRGGELLEQCGPWRLCGQCGTTVLYVEGETFSALACTVHWPGQNVDALHFAAQYGEAGLRRLIHRGLPLEAVERGQRPLMLAAYNGKVRACEILLDHGARLESAVKEAASSCSSAIIRLFLERGVDRSLFFSAVARFGLVRDARLILEEAVDLNAPNKQGRRPLFWAAFNSCAMLRFLLKRGANPNLPNQDGFGVAELCAFRGLSERLQVLLAAGLTPKTLEEALTAACRGGKRHCFELLVKAGAAVNQQNYTPLMAAAEAGSLPLVERLLELGADPTALDDEGKSAREYARRRAVRERLTRA